MPEQNSTTFQDFKDLYKPCNNYLHVSVISLFACKLIQKLYLLVVSFRVVDVLGYKPQELLNELCYDYFHPEDLEHMMESYQQGMNCLIPLVKETVQLLELGHLKEN